MEGFNDVAKDEQVNLPKDNCINRFESVVIIDRWGKAVFTSSQRNFRWYPSNEGPGVYFYYLNFTRKKYQGTLTVVN